MGRIRLGHFCPKNLDLRRALAFFTVLPVRGGGILYKSPFLSLKKAAMNRLIIS